MVHVKLFARIREQSGEADLAVEWRPGLTVADLRNQLAGMDANLATALSGPLFAALNHDMVSFEAQIHEGDEVAFFPPVTGG